MPQDGRHRAEGAQLLPPLRLDRVHEPRAAGGEQELPEVADAVDRGRDHGPGGRELRGEHGDRAQVALLHRPAEGDQVGEAVQDHAAPDPPAHGLDAHPPGVVLHVQRLDAEVGQIGQDRNGVLGADFRAQAIQVFDNLGAALRLVGADFSHVIKLTNYLIDLGHKRIGAITGPRHLSTGLARIEGMHAAMSAKGLRLEPRFVRSGDFREEAAYSAARALLEQSERPTALYVANGLMALGVMRAIADAGLRCPEDVSVASTVFFSAVSPTAFAARLGFGSVIAISISIVATNARKTI